MNRSTKFALGAAALALASGTAAGTAVAATTAAVHPAAATAPTPAFSVAGAWTLVQSNGATVTLTLAQDSVGDISGTAVTLNNGPTGTIASGSKVEGTYIIFTIDWSDGKVGEYTGALQYGATLYGNTVALTNTSSSAAWYTDQKF